MLPDALRALLGRRPVLVVVAGPNGAGKSTFVQAHVAPAGFRFINADVLGRDLGLAVDQAACAADALRAELIRQREISVTETDFLIRQARNWRPVSRPKQSGYTVVLIFIDVGSAERSDERVAMRVSQGGHDVPEGRIVARYPRTLANLRAALPVLSAILVYDNDDLRHPYRPVAQVLHGQVLWETANPPAWWAAMMAPQVSLATYMHPVQFNATIIS